MNGDFTSFGRTRVRDDRVHEFGRDCWCDPVTTQRLDGTTTLLHTDGTTVLVTDDGVEIAPPGTVVIDTRDEQLVDRIARALFVHAGFEGVAYEDLAMKSPWEEKARAALAALAKGATRAGGSTTAARQDAEWLVGRIRIAKAVLDSVEAQPASDCLIHDIYCHTHHAGCLARMLRRALDGEEATDADH